MKEMEIDTSRGASITAREFPALIVALNTKDDSKMVDVGSNTYCPMGGIERAGPGDNQQQTAGEVKASMLAHVNHIINGFEGDDYEIDGDTIDPDWVSGRTAKHSSLAQHFKVTNAKKGLTLANVITGLESLIKTKPVGLEVLQRMNKSIKRMRKNAKAAEAERKRAEKAAAKEVKASGSTASAPTVDAAALAVLIENGVPPLEALAALQNGA